MFSYIFLIIIFFINVFAQSSEKYFVVKMEPKAANGFCMPELKKNSADEILKRNNIKFFGIKSKKDLTTSDNNKSLKRRLSDSEKQALARVIKMIESLGDGRFHYHKGAHYRFGNVWGPSRYDGTYIQINPGGQNMKALKDKKEGGRDNHAVIAHELGHYIGHKGLYDQYRREVGGGCHVSKYAEKKFNEEFSDVFAAYVTNPDILKNKGSYCELAIKFFDKKFGVDAKSVSNTCAARKNINKNTELAETLKIKAPMIKKRSGVN